MPNAETTVKVPRELFERLRILARNQRRSARSQLLLLIEQATKEINVNESVQHDRNIVVSLSPLEFLGDPPS